MKTNTLYHRLLAGFVLTVLTMSSAIAHQGAINLFVDPIGTVGEQPIPDQIYALEIFEIPELRFFDVGVPEISFDGPGLSVNFPSQGVSNPAQLFVDISQDLKYWDGTGLATSTSGIRAMKPLSDNQGIPNNSPVEEYFVTSHSGWMTGMEWGTYNGANFLGSSRSQVSGTG